VRVWVFCAGVVCGCGSGRTGVRVHGQGSRLTRQAKLSPPPPPPPVVLGQHDCLFDKLTVREHLDLAAGIKGLAPGPAAERVIDSMITDVGLQDKQHSNASELSGGQKRRLSVAMALIGDPKVVYLDEVGAGDVVVDGLVPVLVLGVGCWGVLGVGVRGGEQGVSDVVAVAHPVVSGHPSPFLHPVILHLPCPSYTPSSCTCPALPG
jgi:hypothetical protein